MAKTKVNRRPKHNRARHNRRKSNPVRRHRTRTAPVMRRRRRHSNPVRHVVRHRRRSSRNPFGGGWGATFTEGLFVLGGLMGSKYFTQLVLGSSNSGILGYGGNLLTGGLLAWGVNAFMKNPKGAQFVFVGSVIEVIIRALQDYTPYGSFVSQLGVGDYLASNWVSPQRYVDPLHSAQVQIPSGWAPTTTVISSNAAPKGVSGLYSGSRDQDSLY